LIAISVFFTVGIVAVIMFFFVKYREKEKFATGEKFMARLRSKPSGQLFRL
jgi:hypothetical protein